MPPTTSRHFQRAAAQRLSAAEALFRGELNLDAQYLGGYALECSLKALILHRTSTRQKQRMRQRISRGNKMHLPQVLLGELHRLSVIIPPRIAARVRYVDKRWQTDLRYESGRRSKGETREFLESVSEICDWVEEQLR